MSEGNGSGRPRETTAEDILETFDEIDGPVATGKELACELGVSQQTVLRRLDELHETDRVGRKKVGARAVVWWPRGEE